MRILGSITLLLVTALLLITIPLANAETHALPDFTPKVKETARYLYYEIPAWQGTHYFGYDKNNPGTVAVANHEGFIAEMFGVPAFKHPATGDWYLCPLLNAPNPSFSSDNNKLTLNTDGLFMCYKHTDRSQTVQAPITAETNLQITIDAKIKITNNVTVNIPQTIPDKGFAYYIQPTDQRILKYIKNNDEYHDLTTGEISLPVIQRMRFYNEDLNYVGHSFDWTDMLQTGNFYSELITMGSTHGLLIGTHGYGEGNNLYIDPAYIVDVTPQPAIYLINGSDSQSNDDEFEATENITTIMSDDDIYTGRPVESSEILDVTADAYVYEALPSGNYGSLEYLYAGVIGVNSMTSYLKFDESQFPTENATEVILYLYNDFTFSAVNVTLYEAAGPWEENNITWANQPNGTGTKISYYNFTGATLNNYIPLNITPLFNEWVSGKKTHYGVLINGTGAGNAYARFRSKENDIEPYLDCDVPNTGKAISAAWNVTYNPINEYFVNLYKLDTPDTTYYVHAYETMNNVSSQVVNKTISGEGWQNINVTPLIKYEEENTSLNYTKLRIYSYTESIITEIRLRSENNDTNTPTNISCDATHKNLECLDTTTLYCNASDESGVDNVTAIINGTEISLTMNATNWAYDWTPADLSANKTYNWTNTIACDLFNQCNDTTQGIIISYQCGAEEYINITHEPSTDVTVINTTATIEWTTANASDSRVDYGTTLAMGSNVYQSPYVTTHVITITSLTPNTTYYYNLTSEYNPTQTVGPYNFTTLEDCHPNWQNDPVNQTSCRTNNTVVQLQFYRDANACGTDDGVPGDNGTLVEAYCDFCTPDWQEKTGGEYDCQSNGTRKIEYEDDTGCYDLTNLSEDAPPLDNGTTAACDYTSKEYNCSIATDVWLKKKVDYTCNLPYNGVEWSCINSVMHGATDVLQTNPQQKITSTSLLTLASTQETRTSFTTTKGLLVAYYTDKNLVADEEFRVITTCTDGNTTLTHEEIITTSLRPAQKVVPAYIWIKDNATFILITLFGLMILVAILAGFLKTIRRAR